MDDIIGLSGVAATIFIGVISCIVTWVVAKRADKKKTLKYEVRVLRLLSNYTKDKAKDITIRHGDEILVDPCILEINIINSGNIAIEKPPISIKAIGTTYVMPGYFEEIPNGYESLWSIEKINAEECYLHIEHINPKQIIKARFYLNEYPTKDIDVACPMPNLLIKKVDNEFKYKLAKEILNTLLPIRF